MLPRICRIRFCIGTPTRKQWPNMVFLLAVSFLLQLPNGFLVTLPCFRPTAFLPDVSFCPKPGLPSGWTKPVSGSVNPQEVSRL